MHYCPVGQNAAFDNALGDTALKFLEIGPNMFLSSFAPSVVCGSALSAKEAAASAAAVEVADEVGVDIADALEVLTFEEAKGADSDKRLVKETPDKKRSRYIYHAISITFCLALRVMFSRGSTPGSATFESKKLLEEQDFYPKISLSFAAARRLRGPRQLRFDERELQDTMSTKFSTPSEFGSDLY